MIITDSLRHTIKGSGYINGTEILVLDALISYANSNTCVCYPKVKTIVEQTQKSINTVRRAINTLIEKGIVKKESRFNPMHNGQTSNLYTLNLSDAFWNDKAKDYLDKKNKGRCRPKRVPYTYQAEVNDQTPDMVNDNISKANCQLFTTPEKHEKSIEKPKKLRNTVISEHKKISQKNFEPQEKVSLEQIKIDFKYDELLKAAPARNEIIEPLFTVLYKVFNTPKNVIKINRNNVKPTEWVINRVKRLTLDNISEIIERIATGTETIKNWGAYLLTCLIDFIDISSTNKQREANAGMKQNTTTVPKPKLNKFHNFEERTDDLDALFSGARYKLGVEPGKASETPATPDITDYDAILRNKYAAFRIA